jgi:hypothetical protein
LAQKWADTETIAVVPSAQPTSRGSELRSSAALFHAPEPPVTASAEAAGAAAAAAVPSGEAHCPTGGERQLNVELFHVYDFHPIGRDAFVGLGCCRPMFVTQPHGVCEGGSGGW